MAGLGVYRSLARRFFFKSFSVEPENGRIVYEYATDAGHSFSHVLSFEFPPGASAAALSPAAFALGLAELPSYWKAILAPEIVIEAGRLSPDQVAFWESLYTKGLGEFFYVNGIDFRGLVRIVADPAAPAIVPLAGTSRKDALVPFGGGKDSLVTGELLKRQRKDFTWFEIRSLPFSQTLKEASGVTRSVFVGRDSQKNFAPIVELVKRGAPNGHVPITVVFMFGAVLAAAARGFSDVVLSLERSADFGNVEYLGTTVNHQYSKSFEFEQAAAAYVARYVDRDVRVFSLLRSLYELQIVHEFTAFPQYFDHFISCNHGLKRGVWCGTCPKCAFMFAALSAFLPQETVVGIFKKDLFVDESLVPLYEELIGMHSVKPFDCVGTFEENQLSLFLSAERYRALGKELPPVLGRLPVDRGAAYRGLLDERGPHQVPADYQAP